MKNINESGRSMVEMLGVLAIIGVLSIGGIAGYTMAMNKYQANEIVNTVIQAAIHCRTRGTNTDTSLLTVVDADTAAFATLTCESVDTGEVKFSLQNTLNPAVPGLVKKGLPGATEASGFITYTPAS